MSSFQSSRSYLTNVSDTFTDWDITVRRRETEYFYVKYVLGPIIEKNHMDYRELVGEALSKLPVGQLPKLFDGYIVSTSFHRDLIEFYSKCDEYFDLQYDDIWTTCKFDILFAKVQQHAGPILDLERQLPIYRHQLELELIYAAHTQDHNVNTSEEDTV